MVSLLAAAFFTAPSQPPPLGRVFALDPCRIAGVDRDEKDMPFPVPTGSGGVVVELDRGTARLRIENANGGQTGSITMVGSTKLNFKKNVFLFPLGFVLNSGTIDCVSDPNNCQLSIEAGTCSIVTTGTHFQVVRSKNDDVNVEVYEGSVNITMTGSGNYFRVLSGMKGTLGRTTSGGSGFNYGWLTSKEKQDHRTGPAHIR